ncbi:GNAT family N-acetyltransferase [Chloroflexota bacterium]
MIETVVVEQLKASDKTGLIDLLVSAFKEHPLIPSLGAEKALARKGMNAFLDCFGGADSSAAYGIRKDDEVISALLCMDADAEPARSALMQLVFLLARTVGWDTVKGFEVIAREEPKYQGRYLEIMIFGTLPECQQQGFGRKLLQFLYDEARRLDYIGLTLLADHNTPAFKLYSREGFVVDRDFTIGNSNLCWMRLDFQ